MPRRPPTYAGRPHPEPMTAEELLRISLPNLRTELVDGELFVSEPAGFVHGVVAQRIALAMGVHVNSYHLGIVVAAETGFVLRRGPDTVRAPDVGFIARERIPDPPPRGFAELAPDLVAEVLSPDDRPGAVAAKTNDWLASGVRVVWIVDPARRTAHVWRSDGSVTDLAVGDALDGEGVIPGLRVPLDDLFG
jgi:Uma2 family endonuclease